MCNQKDNLVPLLHGNNVKTNHINRRYQNKVENFLHKLNAEELILLVVLAVLVILVAIVSYLLSLQSRQKHHLENALLFMANNDSEFQGFDTPTIKRNSIEKNQLINFWS